jgi:23S rRNA pseudouridine1911/1915/1917 synthase
MKEQITPIYEDKNFLAVYKPAGLLVHAPKVNSKCQIPNSKETTLVDWLLKNYPEVKGVGDEPKIRPGIVHRLDKDVSGVILIAKNQKYFEYLKNLFGSGGIKKTYLALVYGKVEPKTGMIEKPIFLKHGTTKRSIWGGKMEKPAITEYKVIKNIGQDFSLLKVMPKTGRTHQIRVHLVSIGHPVVGDSLYGKKINPFGLKRLFLHAESLEFSPSQSKRIKIESELPNELKLILKNLTNK